MMENRYLQKYKDEVAIEKGYCDWSEMENFIIDNNSPVDVGQLLVSAMEEVFKKVATNKESLRRLYNKACGL